MPAWIALVIGSVIFTLVGSVAVKQWVGNDRPGFFIVALLLYFISSLFWIFALKRERLVLVEALWGVLTLVATVAVGLIVLHEKISVPEGIGVLLAVIATVLLTVKL